MSKRKLALAAVLAAAVALAVALAVATAPGEAKPQATLKAAWIYVGPHNDGGWSQAHDKGRQAVQKSLGSKVKTTLKENVPEGPQTSQVFFFKQKTAYEIIFATSFGFQNAMYE